MELILFWIYVFLGDRANYWCKEHMLNLQGEIIFNTQRYIVGRIISAALLGWLTIPIVGGWKLIGFLKNSSHSDLDRESTLSSEDRNFSSQQKTQHMVCTQQADLDSSGTADDKLGNVAHKTVLQRSATVQAKKQEKQEILSSAVQVQGNEKYSIQFLVLLAKELIKDFYHGITSLLKNEKTRIPSIAIFVALCTSGFIVPVLIIGGILFVALVGFCIWKV